MTPEDVLWSTSTYTPIYMLHTKNKSEQAHSLSSTLTLADITNQPQNSLAEPDAAFPEFFPLSYSMQPFHLTSTVSPQNEFSLHSEARTSPGGFLEEESGVMGRIGYLSVSNCGADGEGPNYVLKNWDVPSWGDAPGSRGKPPVPKTPRQLPPA